MEQLLSHIRLTASSYRTYMRKYLLISSYIRKPFLIYDFATAPLRISLYMRNILFSFYQCTSYKSHTWWSILKADVKYIVFFLKQNQYKNSTDSDTRKGMCHEKVSSAFDMNDCSSRSKL
jgi:hypothetical protein